MTETPTKTEELAETTSDQDDGADTAAAQQDESRRDSGPGRRRGTRERASEKQTRIGAERRRQAEVAFQDFRHLRDCPEEGRLPGDEEARVEFYPATKPRDEDNPERRMLVLRCIECGEAEILPDESEE